MAEVTPLLSGDPEAVAGYRLAGRLGEGGQGTVFLGHGPAGEKVAVKLLHARFADDPAARTRFRREISAVERVARFSTAQVLDADVSGDRPYIVSEYVDGPSLQELVGRQGPLSGSVLQRLAVGTATALAAIHRAGIVHRDFKPANVLLGPDGPRVIDFGIARVLDATATMTSHAVGTPSYMAPEQLSRGAIGPATDMFAWACTMVYAATGTPPFGNDTVPAVIRRILRSEPDLSGLPDELRGLVTACLVKDPEARPTAGSVFDRVLGQAEVTLADAGASAAEAAGRTLPDRPTTAVTTLRAPPPRFTAPPQATRPYESARGPSGVRRPRWPLLAGAAAAVVAVAGVGIWVFAGGPARFTRLPAGCGMVSAPTVQRLMVTPPVADPDSVRAPYGTARADCAWKYRQSPATGPYRNLSIGVLLEFDGQDLSVPDGEVKSGVDRAKKLFAESRQARRGDAGTTHRYDRGTFTAYGAVTDLGGLGDEAFASSQHDWMAVGYDPETVKVNVRVGNALISVDYVAGEQPTARHMAPTPEAQVRKGAVAVAREVVHSLTHCTACAR